MFSAIGAEHPRRKAALDEFFRLMVDDERGFFFQPCFSPVWDTAIAAFALTEAEIPAGGALERCADWLVSKEIRRRGDWSIKRPNLEPSGWCFEFANEFYPDIDDTAMVLLALSRSRATDAVKQQACEKRAINWLVAMQGKDGGWAAFDVDNNWQFLSKVPFADHNAMLDPIVPGYHRTSDRSSVPVRSERRTIPPSSRVSNICSIPRKRMEAGTAAGASTICMARSLPCAVCRRPASAIARRRFSALSNGSARIRMRDGGWGESCASYDNGTFTPGPSTASQTAWAILGLLAGGDTAQYQPAQSRRISSRKPASRWDLG